MKRISSKAGASVVVAVIAALVLLIAAGPAFGATSVTGTGATFPQLLYSLWASHYNKATGVQVNYTGTGSGAGQSAIEAGTVDFGASDQPLTKALLDQYKLVQFPTVIGGIVAAYNVPGLGSKRLRLTGDVLAKIYLGDIKNWNDPAITALNPGLNLPSNTINVIYRSDSSGTSWNFTTYLSRVNTKWRTKFGASKSPAWPVGSGSKGSAGVASSIRGTKYSLGYVEYSFAQTSNLPSATMQNRNGKWVTPSAASFAAAALGANWSWTANQFQTILANAKGNATWPMTAATFVIIRQNQASVDQGKALLKFFNWGFTTSQAKTDDSFLKFVPLPTTVVSKITAVWKSMVSSNGTPCWPA